MNLVVRARRVVLPDGEHPAAVHAEDGRITAVTAFDDAPTSAVTLLDDEVLLPGLVDSHVHVNEPGRTEWEGFASATRAAVAGGITTIVDMPLNSIPATTTPDALHVKREAAKGQVSADVAFWGGAVPGNLDQLRPLHEAGVVGFKCFLLDSGVPEFPPLDDAALRAALAELTAVDGLLIAHAEDADVIAAAPEAGGPSYARFLASRPGAAEESAIGRLVAAARDTGARVYVVHVADADALPILRKARSVGVRITVETCPHYLTFAAEEVPDGATSFKCCPPIREARHREGLWAALLDGDVDLVVSDHSPCTADLKRLDVGDFGTAWGGIASLQVALPVVWSGARARGIGLERVVRWMADTPARLVGLPAKGSITVGKDADLVAFAPEERWTVGDLEHRNPLTPYAGRELHGVVRRTWLRGQVADGGPIGRLLDRGGL
ncbi:allantoinase AllB [Blastococcus mobilis]|uniref:allantoinase n=1 Tax=Blastococcus mobilis TaxID=1938746 RepID=A0A239AVL1_9ACTN|nr:allantoinase AllB [Blastococcus mobilis]SNR99549.1 allantoinase [Blastococcus mobilis]